jgi:hypothetical protein
MAAFVPGMLDAFAEAAPEPATTAPRRECDPQRDVPVGWAVAALRWSPKPSAAAAVVGIGLAAAAQRAAWPDCTEPEDPGGTSRPVTGGPGREVGRTRAS